jgi:hypothetical protein
MGRIPLLVVALVAVQLALAAVAHAQAPSSAASPPPSSSSATFEIPYTASPDAVQVDLWVKRPGDGAPTQANAPHDAQNFTYTADGGDGTYSFYTVATGLTGTEDPPSSGADGSTLVDTTPPTSQASAPSSSSGGPITIGYSAGDAGNGVQSVELWVKRPGASSYTLADTDTSPDSPSFAYGPAAGDGSYAFYTIAVDRLGNREPPPASADATTVVKSAAPATTSTSSTAPLVQAQSPQQPKLLIAAVSLPKGQDLNTVLRKGLALELTAYRAVSLKLELSVSPRTAKALGLRNPRVAAHNWQVIMPKAYALRLRLNRATIRRLRKVKRVHFELRSVLSTPGGNSIATNPLTFGRP